MVLYFTNTGGNNLLKFMVPFAAGGSEPVLVDLYYRLKLAIQPVAIYGTTRHIAIQPVIQPVVIYGTAVQTVRLLRFKK